MVVDDEVDMLEGVRACLSSHYSITGYLSGEEAVTASKSHIFPVAIIDLKMKGISGIETVRQLKENNRYLQAIILTGHVTLDSAIDTVNIGVFQLMQKPFRVSELLKILSGAFKRYDELIQTEDPANLKREQLMDFGLTRREAQVTLLSLQSKTNQEIAETLEISKRTVEKHMENVLHRFKLPSRVKLSQFLRELRQKFLRGS